MIQRPRINIMSRQKMIVGIYHLPWLMHGLYLPKPENLIANRDYRLVLGIVA